MEMEAEGRFHHRCSPSSFPPGVRFTPTDEELITYYLTPKVRHQKIPCDFFIEDDLYLYHPQELAEKYEVSVEGAWYLFTRRIRKYVNGGRPNRSAGMGYWKATGSDQQIRNSKGKKIGYKKSLAYHVGKQPEGEKTGWVMQEYRIDESQNPIKDRSMVLDDHVLCKIYHKEVVHPRDSKKMQIIPMEQSYQLNFEAPQIPLDVASWLDEPGMHPVIQEYEDPTMVDIDRFLFQQ